MKLPRARRGLTVHGLTTRKKITVAITRNETSASMTEP
jgi:hypothetical protein